MAMMIAGDMLEGGGQILRMSVALSAITGKAIHINKIRAKRRKPGLAPQHLHGVRLVQEICKASVFGAKMKSTELNFAPGTLASGEFSADTKTAGSIALLLQVALPCCLLSDGRTGLTLKGGTNADMAPPIDYTIMVFLPILKRMGVSVDANIIVRGFYPKGGGVAYFQIEPLRQLKPIHIVDFGELSEITGEVYHAGRVTKTVAEKMSSTLQNILKTQLKAPVRIRVVRFSEEEAFGSGCGINLVARSTTGCLLGASEVGNVQVPPENLARYIAEELLLDIRRGVCVDRYLQDQLIIYMALATGLSRIRTGNITLHTETAIYLAKQLTAAEFTIKQDGDTNIIECEGIGFINPSLQ